MDETDQLPDTGPGAASEEPVFGAPLTDAMRANPDLWLENFKERLCLALDGAFVKMGKEQSFYLEHDWACELNELAERSESRDKVATMLFSNGYAEEEVALDARNDNLLEADDRLLADELKDLLNGSFEAELGELAEALEVDDHDLRDRLVEEEEDYFQEYRDENIEDRCYYKVQYSGLVGAYVSLGSGNLDPTQDGFPGIIDLLHRLRIDVESFLGAVERFQDAAPTGNPYSRKFSDFWSSDAGELEAADDEPFDRYARAFRQAAQGLEYTFLKSPSDVALVGAPAVAPDDLVRLLADANDKALYLHVFAGTDTIEKVGKAMSDSRPTEKALSGRCVRVASGFLSTETSAYRPESIELRSFIDVDPSEFRVCDDVPRQRQDEDSLDMLPHLALDTKLYQAICDRSCMNPYSRPFDLSIEEDQKAADCVTQILSAAPWWAAMQSTKKWESILPPSVVEATRCRRTPEAIQEATLELLRRVEDLQDRGLHSFFDAQADKHLAQLSRLVELGARCDVPNAVGADAFQILCAKGTPAHILEMAASAHADIARPFENKSPIDGSTQTLNAASLSVRRADHRYASPESRKPFLDVTRWLLDKGIAPAAERDLVALAGMQAPDVLAAAFNLYFADEPYGSDDPHMLFRRMLDECVLRLDKHTLVEILRLGADERMHRTEPFADHVLRTASYPSEARSEFLTTLHALTAKREADEAVQQILAAASTRSSRAVRRIGA